MRLVLDDLRVRGQLVQAIVPPTRWVVVTHPAPGAVAAAIAGTARAAGGRGGAPRTSGSIVLDGTPVERRSPEARVRRGLLVVVGHVGDLDGFTVADVLLLGRVGRRREGTWKAALGGRAAAMAADAAAAARDLGGRVGLGEWLDRDAVGLPVDVDALLDAARAVAAAPAAVVVALPPKLPAFAAAEVRAAVAGEQARLGYAVLEVVPA